MMCKVKNSLNQSRCETPASVGLKAYQAISVSIWVDLLPLQQIRVLRPLSVLSLSSMTFRIFICKPWYLLRLLFIHETTKCFSDDIISGKKKKKSLFALTWSLTEGIWNWQNFISFILRSKTKAWSELCIPNAFHFDFPKHTFPSLLLCREAHSWIPFRISVLLPFSGQMDSIDKVFMRYPEGSRQTDPDSFWDQES